jgi:hypothetical protein
VRRLCPVGRQRRRLLRVARSAGQRARARGRLADRARIGSYGLADT